MPRTQITIARLRLLIGRQIHYRGEIYEIFDLLEEEQEIVLARSLGTTIQPDQFGDAHRKVPETLTVPIYTPDGKGLHPEFLELNVMDQ